jgi:uncharacterized protein
MVHSVGRLFPNRRSECRNSQEIAIHLALAAVICVLFIASVVRSAFGFGEAVVAVPLLAFWIPLQSAAPLAVLASVTVALIVVAQDWKHIHLRAAAGLLASTLLGLPLGLMLLTSSHQHVLRFGLGALIALFSFYGVAGRGRMKLQIENKGWMVVFGALAGFLGGAFGMNGPALAIYGALRRWPAANFRATLQAYFLPASTMGLIGFWRAGVWTPTVTHQYLFALPAIVPGVFVGRYISQKLDRDAFLKYIYFALMVVGFVLMVQGATGHRA